MSNKKANITYRRLDKEEDLSYLPIIKVFILKASKLIESSLSKYIIIILWIKS